MASKAQVRSKSKKPTNARAKAHDRRLLKQAEVETAEGSGMLGMTDRVDAVGG